MLKEIVRITLILFLALSISGCKKEQDQVPYVLVDITLFLDLAEFSDLTVPSGSAQITGGSRGIIVYRVNQNDFQAFDRHCTHNVEEYCQVHIDDETGVTANCECCSSVFSIQFGTPVEGPAGRSLREYRTTFNGNTNQLRIFN